MIMRRIKINDYAEFALLKEFNGRPDADNNATIDKIMHAPM